MTNIKRCHMYMEQYLNLDIGETPSAAVRLHIAICTRCRKEVQLLESARIGATHARLSRAANIERDTTPLMARIEAISYLKPRHISPISLKRWVVSGLIMLISLLSFTLVTHRFQDTRLTLFFYLMFAGVISVYGAMFIGCNMDFFIDKLQHPHKDTLRGL